MTKKALNLAVLELCEAHGAPAGLTQALNELTVPKVGGSSDVNDYTCFGEDGEVAYILCNVFKQWLPVSHFKDGKAANGFSRYSDEGRTDLNGRNKIYKAGKKAVIDDLLEDKISNEDAKEALAELEATRIVVGEAPEDAVAEKPCADVE